MRLLQRFLGALIAIALFAVGLVFATAFFVVALGVAMVLMLFVWGWFRWKTRKLRRDMHRGQGRGGPTIIEGEYRVERESASVEASRNERRPE